MGLPKIIDYTGNNFKNNSPNITKNTFSYHIDGYLDNVTTQRVIIYKTYNNIMVF